MEGIRLTDLVTTGLRLAPRNPATTGIRVSFPLIPPDPSQPVVTSAMVAGEEARLMEEEDAPSPHAVICRVTRVNVNEVTQQPGCHGIRGL